MKRKIFWVLLLPLMIMTIGNYAQTSGQSRERLNFDWGWKFLGTDNASAMQVTFDDSKWRSLDLPHDWSIEGKFSEQNPATPSGGALPGGIGWYRKTFTLPSSFSGKMVYIDFDGVYRNSEVWINGHFLGKRPYGYSSFRYDISPFINTGSKPNIIAVKVDNSVQPNSRWYSGSGIYRNVWLVVTGNIAVDHWGTYITTPEVSQTTAKVVIHTRIRNSTGSEVNPTLTSGI